MMIAIIAPVLLAAYLLITDFIDLFPYNDVSKHTADVRRTEKLNYILPVISGLCSALGYTVTNIIALIVATLFLYGHIWWWWLPYFFGCSEARKERYQEKFGRTIKILPPIDDHPIPNLEHLPVGVLILVWFIATLITLIH